MKLQLSETQCKYSAFLGVVYKVEKKALYQNYICLWPSISK
jgi:hypothetical protein